MGSKNTYYVSCNGLVSGNGTAENPFNTIQKAADIMQPGDTCVISEGVYREWVKPPRGGSSDTERITYKAEKGAKVQIKGSEQVTDWVFVKDGVWKIELPDSFFGEFNPFKTNVGGRWMLYGQRYHVGEVYLDGKPYCEKLFIDEVYENADTWFTEAVCDTSIIYANFGSANPNEALTEINKRKCIFFPDAKGLRFITLEGLSFEQAAANWVNFMDFQHAAVGTYYGRNWIIQNCHISDAKCVGLVCGNDFSDCNEGFDMEETGHHIVRNNWIRRCGEAGIHGYKGWVASLIEGNLIEDINVNKQFGGYETAGMKIHHAVDVIIRNNVIRRVYSGLGGHYAGIWIDWGAQGTRITGNLVYDMDEWNGWTFFIQNSHNAPVLFDNNIFIGQVMNTARNTIFAHNLFVDSRWYFMVENFTMIYFKPHTAEVVENISLTHLEGDRYYNNIFIKKGTDQLVNGHDYTVDYNVYYDGARKGYLGEDNSIVRDDFAANFRLETLENGVKLSFSCDDAPFEVKCPAITHDFIGIFPLTGQGLDDHYGNPIDVDVDINGHKRCTEHPAAGPFENIKNGENTFVFTAGLAE